MIRCFDRCRLACSVVDSYLADCIDLVELESDPIVCLLLAGSHGVEVTVDGLLCVVVLVVVVDSRHGRHGNRQHSHKWSSSDRHTSNLHLPQIEEVDLGEQKGHDESCLT